VAAGAPKACLSYQRAASLLLNYYGEPLEIVGYISEWNHLIIKSWLRIIRNSSIHIKVLLAYTWKIKDWQIPLSIILKFAKKHQNMATLLLAHLRLFLNNVQLDSDWSTVSWICKKRRLTMLIRYFLAVTMSQILKFKKKGEELLKKF
jgi:hypothetical protein